MNIGYDGKRAFQNKTGLGNYSRSLLSILNHYFPKFQYILFAPKKTNLFDIESYQNFRIIEPQNFFYKKLSALWRRIGIVKQIDQAHLDIYHGLSNELPKNIEKLNIINDSIINFSPKKKYELVLVKGVLIHINPNKLKKVYNTIYKISTLKRFPMGR
jgi:hypothetical protein